MLIGNKFWSLPIIVGLVASKLYPYAAFQLNVVIYFLLVLIMFLTSMVYDFNQKKPTVDEVKYVGLYLFFSMIFVPAVIWMLGLFLIKDVAFQQGVLYMALSPLAIVAPHFVKLRGGNDQISFQLMWLSNFLAPIFLFTMTWLLLPQNIEIDFLSYFRDMLFVGLLPILFSVAIKAVFKIKAAKLGSLSKVIPLLNFTCIGLITYTLFGTINVKIGFSTLLLSDLASVFGLSLLLDFGSYFAAKYFFKDYNSLKETLSVTVSIKNVALTSGLLLFYHPKMAFAAAIGLLAHALYFFYLSISGSRSANSDNRSNL